MREPAPDHFIIGVSFHSSHCVNWLFLMFPQYSFQDDDLPSSNSTTHWFDYLYLHKIRFSFWFFYLPHIHQPLFASSTENNVGPIKVYLDLLLLNFVRWMECLDYLMIIRIHRVDLSLRRSIFELYLGA